MRSRFRRHPHRGIHYFYFDLADPSHESLLKKARKLGPLQAINKITQYDEY